MRNLLFILLALFIGTLKSQTIDSIKVLNGTFITTNDTVRIKVYMMSPEGGGVQSNTYSINGSVINGTVHMCSGGLSFITNPTTVIKINPLPQGTYKVKVKLFDYDNFINTSCTVLKSSVSDSININVQLFNGINETSSVANNVTILPNPFASEITIHNERQENLYLSITNALGQKVYNNSLKNEDAKIDLFFLPSGIYYFKINNNNSDKVFKIIKN